MPRTQCLLICVVLSGIGGRAGVEGQVVERGVDTAVVVVDPRDVLSVARAAQAGFERRRFRHLPLSVQPGGGACDEHVGRFCTWYLEGEWYPVPEHPEIIGMRRELGVLLDSLQSLLPDDGWLLGQRVWYRAEGGHWGDALAASRSCGRVEPWWCRALTGFALHGLGRFREAQAAFEDALLYMEEGMERMWRVPGWAVDSDTRDLLRAVEGSPEDEARLLRELWQMADPLYVVAGNDRLTAHYARWTVATIRDDARNPFHVRWGRDLDQLTVRHGWELGWERSPSKDFSTPDHVIGHKHPEGRDFMPPGVAIADPASASVEALTADRRSPGSLYAPGYAPVLLPMDGQLAVFPRGSRMVIVTTHFLPEDTTLHAAHAHDLPWMDAGVQSDMRDRSGLFAIPVGGGRPLERVEMRGSEGVLMLDVPVDAYVISAESWSPKGRRAGRLRRGIKSRVAPEDIASLSDILLLRPSTPPPPQLESALHLALPRPQIRSGQSFAIGWEVAGLGFRPETLHFEVSVVRTDRSIMRRVGGFLRISDRPRPLVIAWEEPGPDVPTHHFRYLDLDLPALEEGTYEIRLSLRTANRSDEVTAQTFRVAERLR